MSELYSVRNNLNVSHLELVSDRKILGDAMPPTSVYHVNGYQLFFFFNEH